MQVIIEGVAAHPSQIVLSESLFDYTTTLEFSLEYPAAFASCTLQMTHEFEYVPVLVRQSTAQTFTYLCYPKGDVDFLQGLSAPINMTGDLSALLDMLSMCRHQVVGTTQSQKWVLASMRGKTIMDKISKEVRFVNGGCPTAHFDISGTLICLDVLDRCVGEAVGTVSGTLVEGLSSATSMNQLPGKVRFHFFDDNTYSTKTDEYVTKAGISNMYKFVVSDDRKSQVEARLQAQYWRRYVSSSVETYTKLMTAVLTPGQKVKMMGTEREYVCISVRTEASAHGAEVTGVLLPSIAPTQKLG